MLEVHKMSQRRACFYLGLDRSSVRYEPRPPDPVNAVIGEELRRLSRRHRRWGTPKMTDLVRRAGHRVNHKRIERIWKEQGLPLPRSRPRRRVADASCRAVQAKAPNEVWSYDFVHEKTQEGVKLKMLTVIDEFTRESLEIRVEKRMDSTHVIETLDEIMQERGVPKHTRSDNGPEFICERLTKWLREKGVEPLFIEPGSPWQNGFVESFNGKLRAECLDEEIFWSRAEAQVVVDWWREVYNNERPHQALRFKTPAEVALEARNRQEMLSLKLDGKEG